MLWINKDSWHTEGRVGAWNSDVIPTQDCQIQHYHHFSLLSRSEKARERRHLPASSPSGSFKLVQSNSVCFLLKAALSEAGGRVRYNPQYC